MKIFYQWIFLWLGLCLYAQPSGSCTEGTTQRGSDGNLYGCLRGKGWRQLNENTKSSVGGPVNDIMKDGETLRYALDGYYNKGGIYYPLANPSFTPISSVRDAPSYALGKIFYSKVDNAFYQGVYRDKWHRIDNPEIQEYYECSRYIKYKNIWFNDLRWYTEDDYNYWVGRGEPWRSRWEPCHQRDTYYDGKVEKDTANPPDVVPSSSMDTGIEYCSGDIRNRPDTPPGYERYPDVKFNDFFGRQKRGVVERVSFKNCVRKQREIY